MTRTLQIIEQEIQVSGSTLSLPCDLAGNSL
jgi:hypothetical protein